VVHPHDYRGAGGLLDSVAASPEGRCSIARAMMNKVLWCITFGLMMRSMTTKNPRLTITLTPTLSAQLREISRLTGNSQSSLIAELLEGSQPVFDRLIKVLSAAEGAKQALRGKIAEDIDNAQTKMEAQLGLALDAFESSTDSMLEHMEDIKRRASRRGGDALAHTGGARREALTPLSNRGVRYDPKATKTIAQSQGAVRPKPKKQGVKVRGVN